MLHRSASFFSMNDYLHLSAWLFPKKWTGECSLAQLGVAGGVACEPGMHSKQCGCPEIYRSRLRPSVGLRLTAAVVSLQRVYVYVVGLPRHTFVYWPWRLVAECPCLSTATRPSYLGYAVIACM